jgi:hypothetical protein
MTPLVVPANEPNALEPAANPAADAEAGERREFAARTSRENYGDPESS